MTLFSRLSLLMPSMSHTQIFSIEQGELLPIPMHTSDINRDIDDVHLKPFHGRNWVKPINIVNKNIICLHLEHRHTQTPMYNIPKISKNP